MPRHLIKIKETVIQLPQSDLMLDFDTLQARGLFDQRLPRYTSYPPATAFHEDVGAVFQAKALAQLDPDTPISLYLHIPFCERLCWFCACRTQGVRSMLPVMAYLETLKAELALVAGHLRGRQKVARMHWGGGTPTILAPEMIHDLNNAVRDVFDLDDKTEFSVEIDPTLVDADKITALREAGMTRASIGVQDFATRVQDSIGRQQSFEQTRDAVNMLRAAGITSLNIDLVYGLPFQSIPGFGRTLDQVLELKPDRIALFGYAHVPHMAKRQMLIPEAARPDDRARFALFNHASDKLNQNGLSAIGIDHFARPDDSMAVAARGGHLRRNFQGYTVDGATTLLGLGASSISRYDGGFVQNLAQTGAYTRAIRAGELPGARGYDLNEQDKLHGRVIEMLMCDFAVDLEELAGFDVDKSSLGPGLQALRRECLGMMSETPEKLQLSEDARPLVRRLANFFDTFSDDKSGFSRVS